MNEKIFKNMSAVSEGIYIGDRVITVDSLRTIKVSEVIANKIISKIPAFKEVKSIAKK